MFINIKCVIPINLTIFHFKYNNNGEGLNYFFGEVFRTFNSYDRIPMFDYSYQEFNSKFEKHSKKIDLKDFKYLIIKTRLHDFDIILEIKDKEKIAIKVVKILKELKLL